MFDTCIGNLFSRDRNTEPSDSIMESYGTMPMSSAECSGCGRCAEVCPTKAISVDGRGWSIDMGRCLTCMDCAFACPDSLISEVRCPDYTLTREELVISPGTDVASLERPLDASMRRMFSDSLAMRELDTGSCNACEVELNCMSNQFYDMHRFGIKVVASPRHADAVLVTGPMTENMVEAAERTYDAVPSPKMVIACGTCAISGGLFVGGDVRSVSEVLEPSVFIPGCPPSPDRVVRALVKSLGLRH